ncbi:hypothetical protein ACQBAT_01265 [Ornithinimicrobium sp. Y1847]
MLKAFGECGVKTGSDTHTVEPGPELLGLLEQAREESGGRGPA